MAYATLRDDGASAVDQLFTDGAAYERLMGSWSRRVGDVFVRWLDAPGNLRWLDVGCGTGVFTEQIVQDCSPAAVIGIDPSPDQLAFAQTRAGVTEVEFHVGDAQDLPFSDNSFDVAVMALVIHFVPDPARAITETWRVLRSGGCAAAYVWDYTEGGSPIAPLVAAMKSMGLESPGPPSPNVTSIPALEELWRDAEFVRIGTRTITVPVEFTGFDEFWSSVTLPVGPAGKAIAQMSPDTRERLRSLLQDRTPISRDGQVVYEARANAIQGWKEL